MPSQGVATTSQVYLGRALLVSAADLTVMFGEGLAPQAGEVPRKVEIVQATGRAHCGGKEHGHVNGYIAFGAACRAPLVPLGRCVLADLRYDDEHIWVEDLAAVIGRWRREKRGTREDAVELTDIFASVLRIV